MCKKTQSLIAWKLFKYKKPDISGFSSIDYQIFNSGLDLMNSNQFMKSRAEQLLKVLFTNRKDFLSTSVAININKRRIGFERGFSSKLI